MKTTGWFVAALCLWWLISTMGCGSIQCAPVIIFFYLPYWLPIVGFLAFADRISQNTGWPTLCFLGLAAAGASLLGYFLWSHQMLVFGNFERSMVAVLMILAPTAAVIVLYLIKSFSNPSRPQSA